MERAVVLGGSVAGVLAARVLSGHASEVLVVDRDDLSGGAHPRRGVPQGRQLHALLTKGLAEIEAFFPGIADELIEGGALAGDPGVDWHWYVEGIKKPPAPLGQGISCTRPFLEWHLRQRLEGFANVRMLRAQATGLTATGASVDGVTVSTAGGDEERLSADLVVDCTGRGSRLGAWLGALGYHAPPERKVAIDLGYATRFFRRDPDDRLGGALGVMSLPKDASRPRGAGAFAVENAQWMVVVVGYHDDRPSSDPVDFAARVADEPTHALRPFASVAQPVTDVMTYRFPASVRRDFHKLARFPEGLLVAGDAVLSVNPIYGQGMTSAVLHAGVLADHLASKASPRAYFRQLRKPVDLVWQLPSTEDFRLPHVTGDRPLGLGAAHRIGDLYTRATLRDAQVHRVLLKVLNLEEDSKALTRPGTLLRAYRASRGWLPAERLDTARHPQQAVRRRTMR
jgi:2-polyprenyl-6-methoxyphenol hydroxylase-like FAD-dependent oxidoreductase